MPLLPVELATGGQIWKKKLRYIFLKNRKINNIKNKKTLIQVAQMSRPIIFRPESLFGRSKLDRSTIFAFINSGVELRLMCQSPKSSNVEAHKHGHAETNKPGCRRSCKPLLRWAAEALMGFDLGLYHAPKLLAYLWRALPKRRVWLTTEAPLWLREDQVTSPSLTKRRPSYDEGRSCSALMCGNHEL